MVKDSAVYSFVCSGGALGCITLGSAAPAGQFQAQSVNPLQNPATVGRGGAGNKFVGM